MKLNSIVRPLAMRPLVSSMLCLSLVGCGSDQVTYRADKPVSAEAASRKVDVPFPASAKDIYYVFHAGGMQELQMFVRFSVDPKDVDTAVSRILLDHDKKMQGHYTYPTLSIPGAPQSPTFPDLAPMPWWHPDSITNGYYRSSTNGQPFYVWVDVGQHTIYLCTHD